MPVAQAVSDYVEQGGWAKTSVWSYPSTDGFLRMDEWLPFGKYVYHPYETAYVGMRNIVAVKTWYALAPVVAASYALLVMLGQRWMRSRKAYDLREPLKYWNLALALFSFWGALRTLPHLLVQIAKFGFATSLCGNAYLLYGKGAVGLATACFIWSKYFELLDTAFIILRKKKLSFLHWFHHCTVLLYTWDAFAEEQPAGIYFIAINYSVHAIMYFYYYLAAAVRRPPAWGMVVTVLQLAQMVIGVSLTVAGLYYASKYPFLRKYSADVGSSPLEHGVCLASRWNLRSASLLYGSYLYLFADFFVKRYLRKSADAEVKGTEVDKASQLRAVDGREQLASSTDMERLQWLPATQATVSDTTTVGSDSEVASVEGAGSSAAVSPCSGQGTLRERALQVMPSSL